MKEKRKNRKWKIALAVLLGLLLCIAALAAAWYWHGANSQGKKEYEQKVSKETQDLTDQLIEQIENIDTASISEKTAESGDEGKETQAQGLPQAEQEVIDRQLATLKDERKKVVLQGLAENYSSIMHEQKSRALSMLDELIAQGKTDWNELKAEGKNTAAAKSALASQYLSMVDVMEKNMDQSFAEVVAKMEEKLNAEGFESAPIIDKYKEEYKKTKEENRSIMIDKAMNAIKAQQ